MTSIVLFFLEKNAFMAFVCYKSQTSGFRLRFFREPFLPTAEALVSTVCSVDPEIRTAGRMVPVLLTRGRAGSRRVKTECLAQSVGAVGSKLSCHRETSEPTQIHLLPCEPLECPPGLAVAALCRSLGNSVAARSAHLHPSEVSHVSLATRLSMRPFEVGTGQGLPTGGAFQTFVTYAVRPRGEDRGRRRRRPP